jgi:hypothetical protein
MAVGMSPAVHGRAPRISALASRPLAATPAEEPRSSGHAADQGRAGHRAGGCGTACSRPAGFEAARALGLPATETAYEDSIR